MRASHDEPVAILLIKKSCRKRNENKDKESFINEANAHGNGRGINKHADEREEPIGTGGAIGCHNTRAPCFSGQVNALMEPALAIDQGPASGEGPRC